MFEPRSVKRELNVFKKKKKKTSTQISLHSLYHSVTTLSDPLQESFKNIMEKGEKCWFSNLSEI